MVEDIYPFYHECQDSRLEISTFTFHPKYMQNQALNSTQIFLIISDLKTKEGILGFSFSLFNQVTLFWKQSPYAP